MDRKSIFFVEDISHKTFENDETLPALPLPKLEDTLERYYESLKPFGTTEELTNSRKIIDNFKNGIGRKLNEVVENKAKTTRNWVEKWWEDYGYHLLRLPIHPYCVMGCPLPLRNVGVPETKQYSLKAAARLIYHTHEFWDLLQTETFRPQTSPDGSIGYSMMLYRRFLCTSRIPGDPKDSVETHFRTLAEGGGPKHGVIVGRGRIFIYDIVDDNGKIISPQILLNILQVVRGAIDSGKFGDCVPVLTNDDRTAWAKNRTHLQELSPHNRDLLKLMESSISMVYFDDHSPKDYSENSKLVISGDFHSKWADRSSIMVIFANGQIGFTGEHSAYDGTCSMSFVFFTLMSLAECSEPDWNDRSETIPVPIEQYFDLDDGLRSEIDRVKKDCDERQNDVTVSYEIFDDFGKDLIKQLKFHPDAFLQMVLQLAYYKMHGELAPTYETALMRSYYNGRTETVRSCSMTAANFVRIATNLKSTNRQIYDAFKTAVNSQTNLMANARKGNGVDRHLFGLWCAAYEQKMDIPELYSDPLYAKSGGGGNFVLSTSTLGFTLVNGFVAPMVIDGYGHFYSITTDYIVLVTSAYRSSPKTSAFKFSATVCETLREMRALCEEFVAAKL